MSDYVLNSASVAEPYEEVEDARTDLAALLRALALLDSDSALLPSLRLNTDPWVQVLVRLNSSTTISLGELAHSFYGSSDHDLASFFDSLNRSIPSEHGLDEVSVNAILRLTPEQPAPDYELTFDSVLASGLDGIICAALNFTLIGLLRCELWKFDRMGFTSGSEVFLFDHVAEPSHAAAISARRLDALRSGLTIPSFWSLRTRVFPNLTFGLDVQGQMKKIDTRCLSLIFIRLAELNQRTKIWRDSNSEAFPDGLSEIKGETTRTMKRYGEDRVFRGQDGIKRTYEDHIWIDRGNRIHLILNRESKNVEVGYIGHHLPTMEYPT